MLVEQGSLLGLQSWDDLRPVILGVKMNLLNLEREYKWLSWQVRECRTLSTLLVQSTFTAVYVTL